MGSSEKTPSEDLVHRTRLCSRGLVLPSQGGFWTDWSLKNARFEYEPNCAACQRRDTSPNPNRMMVSRVLLRCFAATAGLVLDFDSDLNRLPLLAPAPLRNVTASLGTEKPLPAFVA
jgi:hypothetical protein